MLRGMCDTADAGAEPANLEEDAPQTAAATLACESTVPVPAQKALATELRAKDIEAQLEKTTTPFRYSDGTVVQLTPKWKERYVDEYTCEELPKPFVQEALLDE